MQIPHQDGMLPLISTLPLHNLHFLLSESIYRHQHVCSNLVAVGDLRGTSGNPQSPPVLGEKRPSHRDPPGATRSSGSKFSAEVNAGAGGERRFGAVTLRRFLSWAFGLLAPFP